MFELLWRLIINNGIFTPEYKVDKVTAMETDITRKLGIEHRKRFFETVFRKISLSLCKRFFVSYQIQA